MKTKSLFVNQLIWPILTLCVLLSACNEDNQLRHFSIDDSVSAMEWKGHLQDGGNNGTIKVTGELLVDKNDKIVSGQINLPLSSLVDINLPTDDLKHQLIHHLQSADFFNMAAHPEIGFKINSLTPDNALPGTYQASGELTILGKTNVINFPVKISVQGNKLEVTGGTSIDRTRWGMTYASDESVTDGMYIKPDIDVQFRLVALQKDNKPTDGTR